ncbi:TrkH family potassium uptake protein [Candidatus Albibeggiatoa sp. nov. BB20]|uniref:TrkH family potassium uptake protein n=1 Tax=Candidatus Albibeggiatoa sp. nov. BB20 TaxID=3162723 RepID=UPI0033659CB8
MHFTIIQKILGFLLIAFSLTLAPPMLVSVIYQDKALGALLVAFFVMFGLGMMFWFPARHSKQELYLRDGFIITAVFWSVLGVVGALPFLFLDNITIAKAVFESVSGFTTTGATVLSGLDEMPKSLLYYRQQLQWLGGLGIIVLAVAILPMLGIGGMQLYRAEAPGPMRDEKLTPRLAHTAKALLFIYSSLTISCALAYWAAGMTLFDAICHSYTTVATGGFSTHDASLGFYDNIWIEVIAIFFMMMGSLNFSIHFIAWRKHDLMTYRHDFQGMVFIGIVAGLIAISIAVLMWTGEYSNFFTALRYASFQVVSIISSTGYLTDEFHQWPLFLPILILGSGFIGGCVGSTTGGIRVVRMILLYKQAAREIMRLIHPNAIITVKIGQRKVSDSVAQAVWGFSFLYMASFILLSLMFMATGADMVTAFAGVASTLNMTGPSLGTVALTFESVESSAGLWILSFAMLLGRLEVFTLLVLLTPAFWRH